MRSDSTPHSSTDDRQFCGARRKSSTPSQDSAPSARYLAAARSALYARQGRASASDYAAETRALFAEQTNLAEHFNHVFAGGKWEGFMDQAYIGYRSWNPPRSNNLGAIRLVATAVPIAAAMGVAVEGETEANGGSLRFDKYGAASHYVEVFNRGQAPFEFTATTRAPWLVLSAGDGTITKEKRIQVSVGWRRAPAGITQAQIVVAGANTNFVVHISTFNPPPIDLGNLPEFIEADGYVAMEAEHFATQTEVGSNHWSRIPNYGHTLSGLRATGDINALAAPGNASPQLEYRLYFSAPAHSTSTP